MTLLSLRFYRWPRRLARDHPAGSSGVGSLAFGSYGLRSGLCLKQSLERAHRTLGYPACGE